MSLTFLIITLVAILLLIGFNEYEHEGNLGASTIILIVYAILIGGGNYGGWISFTLPIISWSALLVGGTIYLVVGLIWSFYKWFRLYKTKMNQYNHQKSLQNNPTLDRYIPKLEENKSSITTWVLFWPFSVMRYVLSDVIFKFTTFITECFESVYNKIGNYVLNQHKIEKDESND